MLLALGLAACARLPEVPEQTVPQVTIGGAVADRSTASNHWFNGGVSLADPLNLVTYRAEYVIDGGDLLTQFEGTQAPPPTTLPLQLGGDAFRQSVATRLPSLIGERPQFSFTRVTGSSWNPYGDTLLREQQAQLSWNPSPVNLQLQWAAPRQVADPAKPLDCGLGGEVQLGLGSFVGISNQSLLLRARSCNVDAPDRAATGLGVESWGGAWQFGRPSLSNKLAFTVLETATPDFVTHEPTASGYELKFSQTRAAGRWVGDSAVGLRRVADVGGLDATRWTAQAHIRRQVHDLAVTAGWQRDADPLWFVPGVARPLDQVSLGLDMRSWLTRQLGLGDLVNANLSYRWNESADPALDGGSVYWNLSKTW